MRHLLVCVALLAACGDDEDVVVDGGLPPIDAAVLDAPPPPVDAPPGTIDAPPATIDAAVDAAPTLAGCELDFANCGTYVDRTGDSSVAITISGFAYTPKCVRVKAGTDITITEVEDHPLAAAPCSAGDVETSFTVDTPGVYGFHCTNHGSGTGSGMSGAILVEP